jgi:glycosyltransferase involved in cell wall biosynthesis
MSVVAIIPAFNEEKTIGAIIDTLKKVDLIDRIIVVSDGSIDNTTNVATQHGVETIEIKENIGKGGAMNIGVARSNEDILLFLDADLIGLTTHHVKKLLTPVLNKKVEMTIGLFKKGKMKTDLAHKITPFLSGQRVLTRELFNKIDNIDVSSFGVEMALTMYVKKNDIPFETIDLLNLTHVTKEKKRGFTEGVKSRMKMYYDIIKNIK